MQNFNPTNFNQLRPRSESRLQSAVQHQVPSRDRSTPALTSDQKDAKIRQLQEEIRSLQNTPTQTPPQNPNLSIEIPERTLGGELETSHPRYNSGYIANFQPQMEDTESESGSSSSSSSSSGEESEEEENAIRTQESVAETQTTSTSPQIGSSKHQHESRARERVQSKEILAIDKLTANHPVNKGLPQLFTPSLLEELTQEDPVLSQLCAAVKNKD